VGSDLIFGLVLGACALAALLAFGTIGAAPAVLVALAVVGLSYVKARRSAKAIQRQRARGHPDP